MRTLEAVYPNKSARKRGPVAANPGLRVVRAALPRRRAGRLVTGSVNNSSRSFTPSTAITWLLRPGRGSLTSCDLSEGGGDFAVRRWLRRAPVRRR